MAQSDAEKFLDSLKMWDQSFHSDMGTEAVSALRAEDNIEELVDKMFERFCVLDTDATSMPVGNC